MNETLRLAVTVPGGGVHCSDKDIRCVKFNNSKDWQVNIASNQEFWNKKLKMSSNNLKNIECDYIIPKNWSIFGNQAYLQSHNDKMWNKHGKNNANTLDLGYWLDKTDKSNKKFNFPFSVGKRDCLGQSLARKELKMFLANLLLNYQIMAVDNDCDKIEFKFIYESTARFEQIPVKIKKRY